MNTFKIATVLWRATFYRGKALKQTPRTVVCSLFFSVLEKPISPWTENQIMKINTYERNLFRRKRKRVMSIISTFLFYSHFHVFVKAFSETCEKSGKGNGFSINYLIYYFPKQNRIQKSFKIVYDAFQSYCLAKTLGCSHERR